jgi:hypothetical protein
VEDQQMAQLSKRETEQTVDALYQKYWDADYDYLVAAFKKLAPHTLEWEFLEAEIHDQTQEWGEELIYDEE